MRTNEISNESIEIDDELINVNVKLRTHKKGEKSCNPQLSQRNKQTISKKSQFTGFQLPNL